MRRRAHVLLVEDDPLTALLSARALRPLAAVESVTVAVDGLDALALLTGDRLAAADLIIVTDLSMPRMTGLELIAVLAALPQRRAAAIAVLTTSADPADRAAAIALGVDAYFVKRLGRGYLDAMTTWLTDHISGLPLATMLI